MRLSLGSRYGAALLLVVLAMTGIFVGAMGLFVEVLEYKLMHETLTNALAEQRLLLLRDPAWPAPSGGDVRRIVVDSGAMGGLSPVLAGMAPGAEQEVELDGRSYMVGRTDVGDRRLYVLLDIDSIETLEGRLVALAAATIIAAALLAIALGAALGRRVVEPIRTQLVKLRSAGAHLSARTDLSTDARPHVDAIQHVTERLEHAVDPLGARASGTEPRETLASASSDPADADTTTTANVRNPP